jgi:hypothetical protein
MGTGGGAGITVEQRVSVVKTDSPELVSLNAGSLSFALHPLLSKIKDISMPGSPNIWPRARIIYFPTPLKSSPNSANSLYRQRTRPRTCNTGGSKRDALIKG